MPTFGLDDRNLNGVIRYFGAISNTIGPFQTHEAIRMTSNVESGAGGSGKQLFELLKSLLGDLNVCIATIPKAWQDEVTANDDGLQTKRK